LLVEAPPHCSAPISFEKAGFSEPSYRINLPHPGDGSNGLGATYCSDYIGKSEVRLSKMLVFSRSSTAEDAGLN